MKKKEESEKESEFGKGLCYCLGLFLAHAERKMFPDVSAEGIPEQLKYEMWFNGASDHLYDLQVKSAPSKLRSRINTFRSLCLAWGHGFPKKKATMKEVEWAVQEAKDLLRLIDESRDVPTEKGGWE
jgi:hypothetical protein